MKRFVFSSLLILLCCMAASSQAGLIYCTSPAGAIEVVHANIESDLSGGERMGVPFLQGIPEEEVTIHDPIRVYELDLITNWDSTFLSRAKFGSWQYLLLHGTNSVGKCEVFSSSLPPKKLAPSVLYKTGLSRETLMALKVAESLPQVKAHDYEVRKIVSIYVTLQAIWLQGKTDNIIIPLPRDYPDTVNYFTAYKPYTEHQMAKILRSMVQDEKLRSK